MERQDFVINIYKKDRRYRNGVRLCGVYPYADMNPKWMEEEVRELRNTLYREADGYSIDLVREVRD
jgi:hypothetical protein